MVGVVVGSVTGGLVVRVAVGPVVVAVDRVADVRGLVVGGRTDPPFDRVVRVVVPDSAGTGWPPGPALPLVPGDGCCAGAPPRPGS